MTKIQHHFIAVEKTTPASAIALLLKEVSFTTTANGKKILVVFGKKKV